MNNNRRPFRVIGNNRSYRNAYRRGYRNGYRSNHGGAYLTGLAGGAILYSAFNSHNYYGGLSYSVGYGYPYYYGPSYYTGYYDYGYYGPSYYGMSYYYSPRYRYRRPVTRVVYVEQPVQTVYQQVPATTIYQYASDQSAYQYQPQPVEDENCLQVREYTTTIEIGGESVPAYGQACLMPDGSWKFGDPIQEPSF